MVEKMKRWLRNLPEEWLEDDIEDGTVEVDIENENEDCDISEFPEDQTLPWLGHEITELVGK